MAFTWTIRADETVGEHTFVLKSESGTAAATFTVTAAATLPATGSDGDDLVTWALALTGLGAAITLAAHRMRRTTPNRT